MAKQTLADLFVKKPTQRKQSDLERVQERNVTDKAFLSSIGQSDPTKKKPSVLDRLFGTMDALGTGTRALAYNAVSDEDVNPLAEMSKALKGENRVEGADILGKLGVDNKWAKLLGGIAVDILLDPTTYLTFGYGSATKLGAADDLARLGLEGVKAADLADAGLDAAAIAKRVASQQTADPGKLAAIAADLLDEATPSRIKAADLFTDETRAIATAVRKKVGTEAGDYGGVKLAGLSLGGEGAVERGAYKAKDLLRKLPGSEALEKGFNRVAPMSRAGNDLITAAVEKSLKEASTLRGKGLRLGSELNSRIAKLIPDETLRDAVTIGIGRQFGDLQSQGKIAEAFQAVRNATDDVTHEAATADLQGLLRSSLDRNAVVNTVQDVAEATGKTYDPANVKEAVDLYFKTMDDLLAKRRGVGIEATSLFGKVDDVPESTGYALGRAGDLSRKNLAAQDEALKGAGIDVDLGLLREPTRDTAGQGFALTKVKDKGKVWTTAEQRMVQGNLLTDLDVASLAQAKVSRDYGQIAAEGFANDITRMFGDDVPDSVKEFVGSIKKTFVDDEATKGFLKTYDNLNNLWKRAATVLNFPRFPVRNGLSNKWFLWADDILDVTGKSHTKAIDDLLRFEKAAKEVGEEAALKDFPELAEAFDNGAIASVTDLIEQLRSGRTSTKLPGLKQAEAFGSKANEVVENWDRYAGFLFARSKGMSPAVAGDLVNKAMLDYSPEMLTAFERNVMKRLVPFYTFMRRSTPQTLETLIKRPRKITSFGHIKENAEAVNPVDNSIMPEWLSEGGFIPLSGGKNPKGLMMQGLLPFADLERLGPKDLEQTRGLPEFIRAPLGIAANQMENLSPLIRTPVEIILNRDMYYGDQVKEFEGQVRRAPSYVEQFDDVVTHVPGLREAWGLVKDSFNIVEKSDPDSGESLLMMDAVAAKALRDLNPWMNYIGRILEDTPVSEWERIGRASGINARTFDTDKFTRQQAYDDRASLDSLLRGLSSQGIEKPAKRKTIDLTNIGR